MSKPSVSQHHNRYKTTLTTIRSVRKPSKHAFPTFSPTGLPTPSVQPRSQFKPTSKLVCHKPRPKMQHHRSNNSTYPRTNNRKECPKRP